MNWGKELANINVEKSNREKYLIILRDRKYSSELGESVLGALESTAKDNQEDLHLRIMTTVVLVKSAHKNNVLIKKLAKQLGFESAKTGGEDFINGIYGLLASEYDDPEVKTFLINLLNADDSQDIQFKKDSTLVVIEMKKDKKATEIIIGLMDNPKLRGTYTVTRAAFALGDIGGEKATRYLIDLVPKEKDWIDRAAVIQAIGLTKNSLARDFLLEQLKTKGETNELAEIVLGFQYLGDTSTIPILRAYEIEHHLDEHKKHSVEFTIQIIEQGGKKAYLPEE